MKVLSTIKSKEKGSQAKKKKHKQKALCQYYKVSEAQGCKLLTDLNFTFYLPKLGRLEPLATLGFIFELFNSFKLFKMKTTQSEER